MPWVHASLDPESHFIGFSSSLGSTNPDRDYVLFDFFLTHCLNVYTIKHRHLCSELLGELNVILFLLAMVVQLDRVQSLVQILKKLSILLSR